MRNLFSVISLFVFFGVVAAAEVSVAAKDAANGAGAVAGLLALLVLIFIVLLPLILLLPIYIKYRRLKKRVALLEATRVEAEANLLASQTVLHNAKAEADGIIQSGQLILNDAKAEADRIIQSANESKDATIQSGQYILNDAKMKAEKIIQAGNTEKTTILQSAEDMKQEIINSAKAEAQAIAGEALEAKSKADEYEKTAKAFQNIIKGYGDEYIIPSGNLLDDLADEYSFADAGKDLKAARARSKDMVADGEAATCDYVEEVRRKTAISFVVDAFNGKVDSILSRARHDNFGTLAQEIHDARLMVNKNGEAFRSARITQEYADARIEELKRGCIAFELRKRDRAEQREIKERMREEEKARREQEKAIKDAAKQEETLRAAMEKARAEIAAATAEEKEKHEAKLAELEAKLAEAEAKGRRAQSMAELTKSGHVYIISNIGSFGEDVLKIGMTRRLEPMDRVRELGDASVPFPFDVHALIYCEDAPKLENALHRQFNENRLNKVNYRKEFFKVGIAAIRGMLESMNIKATFTLKAEALEYRESRSIDNMPEEQKHKVLEHLVEEEEKHEEGAFH